MKKAFALIAVPAALLGAAWYFVGSPSAQSSYDIAFLREGMKQFEASVSGRSENTIGSKMIFTSRGTFCIGTCEADRQADGGLVFRGPGRTEGYFVAPPMRWTRDLAEAQKVATEHYLQHGGDPVKVTTSTAQVSQ